MPCLRGHAIQRMVWARDASPNDGPELKATVPTFEDYWVAVKERKLSYQKILDTWEIMGFLRFPVLV